MVRRHPSPRRLSLPLPSVWLFSDARLAVPVEELAAHLPPGSGIVLRHDSLAPGARWRLARRLAHIARARQLVLVLAATPALARRWGITGVHLRQPLSGRAVQAHRLGLVLTMPVHDAREARTARRVGADAAFISPLYPTRSHLTAPALGLKAWLRLARLGRTCPVALGGMTMERARRMRAAMAGSAKLSGWAAIDAWEERSLKRRKRQKRNAVPT